MVPGGVGLSLGCALPKEGQQPQGLLTALLGGE